MRLENKVCIITGSSKGIGFGIAERFAREGAVVIVNSRREENAREAVEALKGKGFEKVGSYVGDVSKKEVADDMVRTVAAKYGSVDVMVNNAGINRIKPAVELSEEDFRAVMDTNAEAGRRLHRQHRLHLRPGVHGGPGGLQHREGGRRGHDQAAGRGMGP